MRSLVLTMELNILSRLLFCVFGNIQRLRGRTLIAWIKIRIGEFDKLQTLGHLKLSVFPQLCTGLHLLYCR